MLPLVIKSAASARWDCISLGEVMLRLDPREARIHTTRHFDVWEGGGEYNVVRGLRRCFGLRTAIATTFADNPVGRLVEDLILQGGVDTSLIRWIPFDGVGRNARNGMYFLERGFGVRAGLGCSDRGNTAISQVRPGDFDWLSIFGLTNGTRWFHTGGVYAALSEYAPTVSAEAMDAARASGAVVSYDMNYRESLWESFGGNERARQANTLLVGKSDVLFGGEHDFSERLGVDLSGIRTAPGPLPAAAQEEILHRVAAAWPNLKLIACAVRTAHSATLNDYGAVIISQDEVVHVPMRRFEILDRVGGGDSFAAGIIYGMLAGKPLEWVLRCGVAHGALAMTTPGDSSMATLAEVERTMSGTSVQMSR
jgi:2-dehydro-3-deoxygluconokinase